MLSYQDVVTVKLGALTAAAAEWDNMAHGYEELETLYRGKVQTLAHDGVWVGVSAGAASKQFAATRKQFAAAQKEARAIASILRDAHQQFSELIGRVKSLVDQAKQQGLFVNSKGEAAYAPDKLEAMRNHPDYHKFASQLTEAQAEWTNRIRDAVKAVDDADQGVKLALREAAGVKNWFGRALDPLGANHDFNGSAVGDVEVYEARQAEKYSDRLLSGDKLDSAELAEWQRLMRDNSGDAVFSQMVLNHVGPEGTIKLTNQLNDYAYDSDKGNKQQYLAVEKGFANALATVTRNPRSDFYKDYRDGLKEAAAKRYEWQGEEIKGYQSLVTLMRHGEGYSDKFLHDLGDDMIAEERADRGNNIWDLPKGFVQKRDDWFANDPLDGLLEIMSHDPGTSEKFLDPKNDPNDRLEYLLRERDWNLVDGNSMMRDPHHPDGKYLDILSSSDVEDADSRAGLGAALIAGSTGIDLGNSEGGFVPHSDANKRIFSASLDHLSAEGDDFPPQLRKPMAIVMGNYGDEVHATTSAHSDDKSPLNRQQVLEVAKQVSRSQAAYGTLHDSLNHELVHDINTGPEGDEEPLRRAGRTIGFLEEARYQALQDAANAEKTDATWEAKWDYHRWGGLVNFIPHAGDAAQRGVDVITAKWLEEEVARIDDGLARDNMATSGDRESRLGALAKHWCNENPSVIDRYGRDGWVAFDIIDAAANDGNAAARRTGGKGS